MIRKTTAAKLESAHTALVALGCYAALSTCVAVGFGVAHVMRGPVAPADVQFATGDARTAYAKCGPYDVMYIAHDMASVSDATEAARRHLDEGCKEVGRGQG